MNLNADAQDSASVQRLVESEYLSWFGAGSGWATSRRQHADRPTLRIVGLCFVALAVYLTWDSLEASLVVMPLLARATRKMALAMQSGALVAEAKQTALCTWLSAILLGGRLPNATLGWWWDDPVAVLAMVPAEINLARWVGLPMPLPWCVRTLSRGCGDDGCRDSVDGLSRAAQ